MPNFVKVFFIVFLEGVIFLSGRVVYKKPLLFRKAKFEGGKRKQELLKPLV